jgi:epoxyqueuosine reductase QueG
MIKESTKIKNATRIIDEYLELIEIDGKQWEKRVGASKPLSDIDKVRSSYTNFVIHRLENEKDWLEEIKEKLTQEAGKQNYEDKLKAKLAAVKYILKDSLPYYDAQNNRFKGFMNDIKFILESK